MGKIQSAIDKLNEATGLSLAMKPRKEDEEGIKDLLEFISGEWESLVCNSKFASKYAKDQNDLLYLPYDYIVPNKEKFDVMFYWDSYFIILGLKHERKTDIINGIIANCLYEIANYGKVLNANKYKWSTRSQMPYLTLMIKEVYNIYEDKKWLKEAFKFAKKEYGSYWLDKYHLTSTGLSRYYDESGSESIGGYNKSHGYKSCGEASWDMSPRFDEKDVHDLIPIDLNCNLYQYEKDFGEFERILENEKEAVEWESRAEERKRLINDLMWDEREGFFFDYNFKTETKKKIRSLATYQSMLVNLAEDKQAERMKENLEFFRTGYGLAVCPKGYDYADRQWNWPMVWAPLQYICYQGLKNYGFEKEAEEIGRQFVGLVYRNWKETGKIWEKYNGQTGDLKVPFDRYFNQSGFGWTNAVTEVFIKEIYKI